MLMCNVDISMYTMYLMMGTLASHRGAVAMVPATMQVCIRRRLSGYGLIEMPHRPRVAPRVTGALCSLDPHSAGSSRFHAILAVFLVRAGCSAKKPF